MFAGFVEKIRLLFEGDPAVRRVADDPVLTAELMLLFRMVLADGEAGGAEMETLRRICREAFGIGEESLEDVLAYLQDYWIAIVPWAYQPRALTGVIPQVASLDGNVRFHRHAAEGWMLYEMTSPAGLDAIGLASGRLLDRQADLLATAAQEVLLRDL